MERLRGANSSLLLFVKLLLIGAGLPIAGAVLAQNSKSSFDPGLVLTFTAGAASDTVSRPNVSLYVPAGQPPAGLLSAGSFTAQWQGLLSLDLRSEYAFHADFNGQLKIEVNGVAVIETNSVGIASVSSRAIRLNKGTNSFRAVFRSPPNGDAFVRLQWAARGSLPLPIPSSAWSHAPDAELVKANQVRHGFALLTEHRCVKCHTANFADGPPDVAVDGPSLEGIGSRRGATWMSAWILNPKAQRPTARMPRLFQGPTAAQDAADVAAFLSTLKGENFARQDAAADAKETGQRLFESLHCAACHIAPGAGEIDVQRIALKHVRRKFPSGALEAFLRKPEAHYPWTRMPNFKLNSEEATQLAAFLESAAGDDKPAVESANAGEIERGRKLVQTSGCLSCHALKLENQFTAAPLGSLSNDKWRKGCLANAAEKSKAPDFSFSEIEREALRAFASSERTSLTRFVPAEFAERQMLHLNCRECHGKFEGFPPVDLLGGKLKPEWARDLIAGDIKYKPRPWLEARMPAFQSYASGLAQGMAMLHGFPAVTPRESPIDGEAAKIGQKLVSAAGGFSCIACHAVGALAASQGADSPGINLTFTGERLLKSYFRRWVRNPLAIDPTSKMPVYFDEEGKSPLSDVYDGDGLKQIDALWEYIRLGEKMPAPPMP